MNRVPDFNLNRPSSAGSSFVFALPVPQYRGEFLDRFHRLGLAAASAAEGISLTNSLVGGVGQHIRHTACNPANAFREHSFLHRPEFG